jgi:hypothetical protein
MGGKFITTQFIKMYFKEKGDGIKLLNSTFRKYK